MDYTHIIFDIDGTLINTEKAVLISLQDTLKEVDHKHYELNELRFVLGIPGITALEQLALKDTEHASFVWNEKLKTYLDSVTLFAGIEDLVRKLSHAGFHLGIITSKNRFEYNQDFVPFGMAEFFNTIICMEDSQKPKPSPDPMLSFLRKAGADKNNALYIGDTAYDKQCAHDAGVDFGLALWGYNSPVKINAEYYFSTPEDVVSLLVC